VILVYRQQGGKMITPSKKLISLFLILSLLEISCASITSPTTERRFPEKKRGSIVLTKKDGQQIEGELVIVKPNSLLLLDTEGKDVSVDIADIKVIRIGKKSKAGLGARIGSAAGTLGGIIFVAIIDAALGEEESIPFYGYCIFGGIGLCVGALVGGIIGAVVGTDETIHFEGMTDSEIKEALDKLRKKARIRDYK